ncbi:MAG TPA: hypothetical protein VGP07_00385 [Polyangia bacterium]|jgi:hypothetical protein
MKLSTPGRHALTLGLAATLVGGLAIASALPSLDSPELAQGPFASMHMILKKTILRINIATIDVRFDKPTQGRFAELARNQKYSDPLAQQLAQVAIGAPNAVVQMQFKHDVSLDRWMDVVRDNVKQAREAGLITAQLEQQVSQGLPQWFAPLRERGYEKGDRLLYAVSPEGLHTAVASLDGKVLIDRMDKEHGTKQVVLASYFASGSEFREPLIKSLLEGTH